MGLASWRLPWADSEEPSATFSNQMVALGCADDGFNVVPRRVELLFRE